MHVHHRWAQAMTLIQIAIALAAITILTRNKGLQYVSYLGATISIALGALAVAHIKRRPTAGLAEVPQLPERHRQHRGIGQRHGAQLAQQLRARSSRADCGPARPRSVARGVAASALPTTSAAIVRCSPDRSSCIAPLASVCQCWSPGRRGDAIAQPRQAEPRREIEIDLGDELDRALRGARDLDDVERRIQRVESHDPRRERRAARRSAT